MFSVSDVCMACSPSRRNIVTKQAGKPERTRNKRAKEAVLG